LAKARADAHLHEWEVAAYVADYVEREHGRRPGVDADLISRYERGVHAWPNRQYREALRTLFGVATDAELGFTPRRTPREARAATVGLSPADRGSAQVITTAEASDVMKRRAFLGRAAGVVVGAFTFPAEPWLVDVAEPSTPLPERIGLIDAEHVEATTQALRALDSQYGGGAVREAALAHLKWAVALAAAAHGEVQQRLHVAVADLHNFIGWTAFDLRLDDAARHHLLRALERSRYIGHHALSADVLYRMGRLHLHGGHPDEALKLFQLGQIAAQDSGLPQAVAILCANEAWAYAEMGDSVQAAQSLGRAEDELARANAGRCPPWFRFFGPSELVSLRAMVHTSLSASRSDHIQIALDTLGGSLAERGPSHARSRAFDLTALATVHLRAGDLDVATAAGHEVLDIAVDLRSARVLDRLAPLQREANKRRGRDDVDELAARIAAVRG